MAEENTPAAPKKSATPKKSAARKAPVKKASAKKAASKTATASQTGNQVSEPVSVQDMHSLLDILRDGLSSRDKVVDHLQKQIEQNQLAAAQNQKIIAKRGLVYKLTFALLAIGVVVVGFDQHTIVKSFDDDMTNVSRDMDKMLVEMTAMRKAMESMSTDIHSMSGDFGTVAKDVSTIAQDVKSISYGVRGMSHDTRQMNRNMDDMVPPFSPW